jgi:hypothetical protein
VDVKDRGNLISEPGDVKDRGNLRILSRKGRNNDKDSRLGVSS